VGGAGLFGFVEHFGAAAAHDADFACQTVGLDLAQEVDATAVREHQVEQHPIWPIGQALHRVGEAADIRHGKAPFLEDARDCQPRCPVVFHYENRRL